MIPFKLPQLSMTLTEYMKIVTLQSKAGSCAGFLIGLGNKFFEHGVADVDQNILPLLTSVAPGDVNPRVMPSYAILLWFTLEVSQSCDHIYIEVTMHAHEVKLSTSYNPQILQQAGMGDLKEELTEYVAKDILTTASKLQGLSSDFSTSFKQQGQQVTGG